MSIASKLRERNFEKITKRLLNNNIMLITEQELQRGALRGYKPRPVFFEKEVIDEYYHRNGIYHNTIQLGYSTILAEAAIKMDIVIVCGNGRQKDHMRQLIAEKAMNDIKPTCFQKLLIKIGF